MFAKIAKVLNSIITITFGVLTAVLLVVTAIRVIIDLVF